MKHLLFIVGIFVLVLQVAIGQTIPYSLSPLAIQIPTNTPGYVLDVTSEVEGKNVAQYKIDGVIFKKPIKLSDSVQLDGDGRGVLALMRRLFNDYAKQDVDSVADCYTPDAAKAISNILSNHEAEVSMKAEVAKYTNPQLECVFKHFGDLIVMIRCNDSPDHQKMMAFQLVKIKEDYRIFAGEIPEKKYTNLLAYLAVHPATDLLQEHP